MQDAIQQALAAAWRRDYGDREQEVRSVINTNTGDVTVFISKEVVEEVENEHLQITLADAKKLDKSAEIGGTVELSEK